MENVKKFDWIALYNFGKDKLYCCLDNGLYECIPIRSEHAYNKSGGYVYVQTCMGEQRVSPRRIYATPEDAIIITIIAAIIGIILGVLMYYLVYYLDIIQLLKTAREKKQAEKEYVKK